MRLCTCLSITLLLYGFSAIHAQVNKWDLIKELLHLSNDAFKVSDNCFQLTEDRVWSGGSIYFPQKIDLNSPFEMELEVFLGCKDAGGADGMVFIFSPKMAMGRAGEGMGFRGVTPSIGIELDTWENDHLYDPSYDHLAILQNGIVHHDYGLTPPKRLPDLEDCKNHQLKIDWQPSSKKLSVWLDQQLISRIEKDLIEEVFQGVSKVFWGVTASTGRYSNQQKVCFKNIRFKPASAIKTSAFRQIETALLKNEIVPLPTTRFPAGQTKLSESAVQELDELAAFLEAHPDYYLSIYGHTDSSGNPASNKVLSEKRAQAIVDYLVTKGINAQRLSTKGLGDQYPIASNDTAKGREKNRRMEVHLFKPFP